MFLLQDPALIPPNQWSVLQTLITTLGPIFATVVTYLLTRKDTKQIRQETAAQTPKLEGIHVLVNGRMTAALDRIANLESQLASKNTNPPASE
jgi:hypothetical protein